MGGMGGGCRGGKGGGGGGGGGMDLAGGGGGFVGGRGGATAGAVLGEFLLSVAGESAFWLSGTRALDDSVAFNAGFLSSGTTGIHASSFCLCWLPLDTGNWELSLAVSANFSAWVFIGICTAF